jgi:pantothenate synthetase
LLTLNLCAVAKDRISPVAHTQEYYEMSAADENFDFSSTNQYLTEEQLQDAQEIDEIDDKSGFWAKVINSGHFSSTTATKTYYMVHTILFPYIQEMYPNPIQSQSLFFDRLKHL